jgi:hypothetical protein
MKSIIFWGVTPCSLVKLHWSFKETYYFHLQGQRVSHTNNQQLPACLTQWPWRWKWHVALNISISQKIVFFIVNAVKSLNSHVTLWSPMCSE